MRSKKYKSQLTCNKFGCCSSSQHKDSILTEALMDDLFTGIPSNASTASHASLIIRIGALFLEPKKFK